MVQSPPLEASSYSTSQKIPLIS